jgi:hypothetical protein
VEESEEDCEGGNGAEDEFVRGVVEDVFSRKSEAPPKLGPEDDVQNDPEHKPRKATWKIIQKRIQERIQKTIQKTILATTQKRT